MENKEKGQPLQSGHHVESPQAVQGAQGSSLPVLVARCYRPLLLQL